MNRLANEPSCFQSRLIMSVIAMIPLFLFFPDLNYSSILGVVLSIFAGWLIGGDFATRDWSIWLSRIGALSVLSGGAFHAVSVFPDRRIGIYIVTAGVSWIAARAFRSGEIAVAWCCIMIGLSTPPFCELHVERDPWSLIAGLIMFYEIVRGPIVRFRRSYVLTCMLFLAFCIWSVSISGVSVYPHASMKQALLFFFYAIVLFSGLILFNTPARLQLICDQVIVLTWTHLGFAAATALDRVMNLGLQGMQFRWFVYHRHPNYVIHPLLLGIPVLLYIFSSSTSWIRRMASLSAIILTVTYFFLGAYSRGAYIVLIAYLPFAVVYLMRKQRKSIIGIAIGLILVIICGLVLSSPTLQGRIVSLAFLEQDSRVRAWSVFWDLVRERPVVGYGLGTNRYIYPQALGLKNPLEPPTRQFLIEAHNAYLDILVGTGWIGLILFLGFLLSIVGPGWSSSRPFATCSNLLGITILIDFLFNFRFHAHDTGIWAMIFLIFASVLRSEKTHEIVEFRTRFLRPSATLIVILAAAPFAGDWCVQTAKSKLPAGNWPIIQSWFLTASLIEPLNAHPHYYLSLCADQTRQPREVIHSLQTAVALCPNYAFYRDQLARTYLQIGDIEHAVQEAEVAVLLEPFDSEARYRLSAGSLNEMIGNTSRAEMHLSIGISINPAIAEDSIFSGQTPRINLMKLFHENYSAFQNTLISNIKAKDFFRVARPLLLSFETVYNSDIMIPLYRLSEDKLKSGDIIVEEAAYLIKHLQYDMASEVLYRAINYHGEESHFLLYLSYIALRKNDLDWAYFLARRANKKWKHLSLDNFIGFQLMDTILTHMGKEEERIENRRKIDWLMGDNIDRQKKDLTIHTGGRDLALYDLDKTFLQGH